jgi:hypothetical protein
MAGAESEPAGPKAAKSKNPPPPSTKNTSEPILKHQTLQSFDKISELLEFIGESSSCDTGNSLSNSKIRKFLLRQKELLGAYMEAEYRQISSDIESLRSDVLEIKANQERSHQLTASALKAIPKQTIKTWAQVTATESLPASLSAQSSTAPAPITARVEDRELTVRLNRDASLPQDQNKAHVPQIQVAKATIAKIDHALAQSGIKALTKMKVPAARILPSDDIRLTMGTTREAELMKIHASAWVASLGTKAELQIPTFGVLLDGIRIESMDLDNQETAIEALKTANIPLLPAMEIKKMSWLNKPYKNKKATSVIIEFALPEDANAVIAAGALFWEFTSRKIRRYVRNCRIKQCFKCYHYGHITPQCRADEICGFCNKPHKTADCPSEHNPREHKCPLCKKGHPAWDTSCDARRKEIERIEKARKTASQFWPEPLKEQVVSPSSVRASTGQYPTPSESSVSKSAVQKKKTPTRTKNIPPAMPAPNESEQPAKTAGIKRGREPLGEKSDNEQLTSRKSKAYRPGAPINIHMDDSDKPPSEITSSSLSMVTRRAAAITASRESIQTVSDDTEEDL